MTEVTNRSSRPSGEFSMIFCPRIGEFYMEEQTNPRKNREALCKRENSGAHSVIIYCIDRIRIFPHDPFLTASVRSVLI